MRHDVIEGVARKAIVQWKPRGKCTLDVPIVIKLTPEEVEKEELRPEWVFEEYFKTAQEWVLGHVGLAPVDRTYSIKEAMDIASGKVMGARWRTANKVCRIRNLRTGDVLPAIILQRDIDNAPQTV